MIGDLRVLGRRALTDFGVRLMLLFLITAALGLPLMLEMINWGWVLTLVPALALLALLMIRGLFGQPHDGWLIAGLFAGGGVVIAVLVLDSSSGDPRTLELVGWVLAACTGGVGVARGPTWGLGSFTAATVVTLGTGWWLNVAVTPVTLVGPLTFCLGGVAINVAARRGFASTEEAKAAIETAQTAQLVALARSRARRAADRELHDTVLGTLTLLTHSGVGVPRERLLHRCERDLSMLRDTGRPTGHPEPEPDPLSVRPQAFSWLHRVISDSAADGLRIDLHLEPMPEPELRAEVTAAASAAIGQCLENIREHAGIGSAEVTCGRSETELVIVVLDHGRGFDPDAVAPDRLGLRTGIVGRIADVGGQVTVWSRLGIGTTVVVRLPLIGGGPLEPDGPVR